MITRIGSILLLPALVLGCSHPTPPTPPPATMPSQPPSSISEQQKVEWLIQAIRNLHDATFIRNGQEHGPQAAAALLQYRWNRDKQQIQTAEQFILQAATQSSTTGLPYLIRFKNGTELPSAHYLRKKLEELTPP